jgi:hypothetical protein
MKMIRVGACWSWAVDCDLGLEERTGAPAEALPSPFQVYVPET